MTDIKPDNLAKKNKQAVSSVVSVENASPAVQEVRNLNLDSFRGLLALSVIISHVEYIRFFFRMPSYFLEAFIFHLGKIGVTGFFVLSGFLITNNLLKMKRDSSSNTRDIKKFYLKRALRILPLYYAIILLSIFVFPHISFLHYQIPPGITDAREVMDKVAVYYYCLLPQIPIAKMIVLPFAEPTWSIGVEEMFYILAPLFVFFTSFRKRWMVVIAVLLMMLKLYMWIYIPGAATNPLFSFLALSRFECILVGCAMSCLVAEGSRLYNNLNSVHFYTALVLLLISIITVPLNLFIYIHFAIFFGVMILYFYKHPFKFLNNKVLVFIGKISFSIYLVHEIAIVFLLNNETIAPKNEFSSPFLYIIVILFSILLGWVFFKLIEEPFINLKNKIDSKKHFKN